MWKTRLNNNNHQKVSIRTPLSGGQNAEQKQLALLSNRPHGINNHPSSRQTSGHVNIGRGGGIQFRGESDDSEASDEEEITYKPTKYSKIYGKQQNDQISNSQSFYEDSQEDQTTNNESHKIDISPEESHAVLSAVFDDDDKRRNSSMRDEEEVEGNSLPIIGKKTPKKKNSKVVEDDSIISDDDFDKYFDEPSVSLSLNKKSKKKPSSSPKKRKITKKSIPEKISGIYYSSSSSDEGTNKMDFDDEDSQNNKLSSSQTLSQPLGKAPPASIIPSQTIIEKSFAPPSSSYSSTTRKSSSFHNSSTPSTPHHKATPASKRKSQSISYQLPKEIEKDDDIDDFSEDDEMMNGSTIPIPTTPVLSGVNAALFASAPQATMNNSALISTYLTQQRQVMNRSTTMSTTPSKPTIDIDDLIVTDSDEEDTTNQNERDRQFSQMVSITPGGGINTTSTPQQSSMIQKTTPPPPPKQISPPKNANIVISGEDGFDLETRLRGIAKKPTIPKESDIENLLFSGSSTGSKSNRRSNINSVIEDIEVDDQNVDGGIENNNNSKGESWLDKLRKSKAPIVDNNRPPTVSSLSQQQQHSTTTTSLSNSNSVDQQFFSQWDHLKKILSVKSSGRFVSKLIRAVNGSLNEKVFANLIGGVEDINLSQPHHPTKDSMTLKILVFSSSAQIYPNMSICICKILKRPTQSNNDAIDKILEDNQFLDVFLLREMKDKWNLVPGSIIEICTSLFHITPASDPRDSNSDWIYRPRPVISYVFEMKCNNQTSDMEELKQDIGQLESKFTFSMLSGDFNTMTMDLSDDDQHHNNDPTPSTPPPPTRGDNLIRSTPTHVRHKNIINTPRRRTNFESQSEQDYDRNYHLISRISTGSPLTKKFEIIFKQLHSSFFPSYFVNIQGVIQRVWSLDHVRQSLNNTSYNEIYKNIPQLAIDSNMSNSVLIQCSKSRGLCVISLPSGSHEYDYWKSIFDPNISQGKIFQFEVCSFKDRVYIGPNDELYSIISPMYHHTSSSEHNLTTTDSQLLSSYSSSSNGELITSSNPLIPVYFFSTNKQHTSCKFIPPPTVVEDHLSDGVGGPIIGMDPIPENIAPHSSYKHSLYYNFEQPISGDTQQSHGGVEDVVSAIDDSNTRRQHRCDIEGKIIYVKSNVQDQDLNTTTTQFSIYLVQKYSNIILRLDSSLAETSMLFSIASGICGKMNDAVSIHNVLVERRTSVGDDQSTTQLIVDKFSMIYPSTISINEQEPASTQQSTAITVNNTTVKFPYSVKLRVEEGFLKKNGRKIQSESILNSINYEFTCFERSVGNVEGYISDVLEVSGDRPTVPVCPHCQKQLTPQSTWFMDTTNQICTHCNHKFIKPDYDLLFQVKVGRNVTLTLDTRAIQQMFAYKKGATTNKKLPVTGSETFKQAKDLVLGHHVKFLCYCEKVVKDSSDLINYKFQIIHHNN